MTNNSPLQVFKGGWDQLQNTVFTDNITTITSKSSFIKPDGTKIFILNGTNVEAYPLSVPWDVATRGSLEATFPIVEDSTPTGLFFQDDGSKLFVVGDTNEVLFEYPVPDAFDISSIVGLDKSLGLNSNPNQCAFSTTGDVVFITRGSVVDRISLGTSWDIDTAGTVTSTSLPGVTIHDSIAFKPQGDKVYIGDTTNGKVTEIDLPTPFSFTGATDSTNALLTTVTGFTPFDISWRGTGNQLFMTDTTQQEIVKLHLNIDWKIDTASYFSNVKDLSSLTTPITQPRAVFWRPDGLRMYILDLVENTVTAFSSINPFNVNTLTLILNPFNFGTSETNAQGMTWSADGTSIFIVGPGTDTVYKFNTNVAWSVDPIDMNDVADDSFTVGGDVGQPNGIVFSPDGLKMYISALAPNEISQWDLDNPYELPINTTLRTGGTSTLAESIRDIAIKPDGTQFYAVSNSPNDEVIRYILVTPFEISTFVQEDTFDVGAQDPNPQGLFMRPTDGKQFFTSGLDNDVIVSCDMSLEFNNNIITAFGDDLITNAGENIVYA